MDAKRMFKHFDKQHGIHSPHPPVPLQQCTLCRQCIQEQLQCIGQHLTTCVINAHFQSDIARNAIHDLRKRTRKQHLHTQQQWLATTHLALWQYVLKNAVYLHNTLPVLEDGISRLKRFSSIRVGSKMKHLYAFCCPVFALKNDLAAGNSIPH